MRLLMALLFGMAVMAAASVNAGAQTEGEPRPPASFGSCISCHSVKAGVVTFGPNLRGVVGRRAGSLDGYAFSEALKAADFTWDAEQLDAWITNPKHVVAGTKMPFPGLPYPDRRQEIIAYLSSLK